MIDPDSPTACAVCTRREGTRAMADGRLFCWVCASCRPELGVRPNPPLIEAYDAFVRLTVEGRHGALATGRR